MGMTLEFMSFKAFGQANMQAPVDDNQAETLGRSELSKVLLTDKALTSYVSKEQLSAKITNSAAKIDGFVIRGAENKLWGFVLYTEENGSTTIEDMYTLEAGRGNELFKKIGFVFQEAKNWKGAFKGDTNNAGMARFFNGAREPLACAYSIKV